MRVSCSEDCRLRIGPLSVLLPARDPALTVRLPRERLRPGHDVRVRASDPLGNARTVTRAGRVQG